MPSTQIDRPSSTADLSPNNDRGIDRVVNVLGRARRLLFITGAGISADSGLPTYRGQDGLYRVQQATPHGLTIEQALSGPMLRLRPDITWHYLHQLERSTRGATPNRGHHVIAEMERYFDAVWVLTQNVDGLHQSAGSQNVLDIHGNLHELECTKCGNQSTVEDFTHLSVPPGCSECKGLLRPRVVLFGEELPSEKLERLWYEFGIGFDAIFSIGTSSLFEYIIEPVRIGQAIGIPTVEINPDPTTVSDLVEVRIAEKAAIALDLIWERYLAWWPWS